MLGGRLTAGGDNSSTTFSGGILTKTGTGTLTLSGANASVVGFEVNVGKLSVDGSLAPLSLINVYAGAALGGNGTVGNTSIIGGTLAPGNSNGTLTVDGMLVFTSAASYMVDVSPSNAARVNVAGSVTLGGATVNASFTNGSYITRQYTSLNAAGGVTGTFGSQVNTNLPANITTALSYDAKPTST